MKNLSDVVLSEEDYAYDAAGNLTAAPDSTFSYNTNNRLTWYNGDAVSYDADGNMVTAVLQCDCPTYFEYDSANRLLSACGHTYTYNAEDVRIRNLCATEDTKYTYNTNCRLSKLLWKDTNGTVTKYVYGRGLIGEETGNAFKTYHFDCRGSTVALTNASGVITDTFEYDTYGKLIGRTGTTAIIFGYNGRDGVVTDTNGLIYMRARYYSPDMRRFINADIIHGSISDSTSLNRYAYVNGNPVSFIDPFGLSQEDKDGENFEEEILDGEEILPGSDEYYYALAEFISGGLDTVDNIQELVEYAKALGLEYQGIRFVKAGKFTYIHGDRSVLNKLGIGRSRIYNHKLGKYKNIAKWNVPNTTLKQGLKDAFDAPGIIFDVIGAGAQSYMEASQYEEAADQAIIGTYVFSTEIASSAISTVASVGATAAYVKICTLAGTAIAPGVGTIIGLGAGLVVGMFADLGFKWIRENFIEDIVENN